MKKIIILLLLCSQVFGQTNIAVPSYSSVTNSFNASTGNIKFYLNGVAQIFTVGRGANGVVFYGNDMFVAYDDGLNSSKGLLWYANVSFASGTFSSSPVVNLLNGQGTFSVAVDALGNVFCANNGGSVTRFNRSNTAPRYSSADKVNTAFWSNGGFAEASGVFVDNITNTLWAVSYANNQGAVVKLSDFTFDNGFGNNTRIKKFADNNSPNTLIQKPEGIAKDASGNIWIANNNNNYVLRLNNSVVSTLISELNGGNYSSSMSLNSTQINAFAVSASGHQLGGLVFDNLYSNKMYVNDQVSGDNGNMTIYSFVANNDASPTFTPTSMAQVFPGAGQPSVIPCALLPMPSNPTAAGTSINSGQTATLTASTCAADQTYLWKQGATTVATSASFTTPALSTNTSYTAYCVRGASCQSTGIAVNVTINAACTNPVNPTSSSAMPASIGVGESSILIASGCVSGNTYRWKLGSTVLVDAQSYTTSPSASTTYTVYCVNGACESTGFPVLLTVTTPPVSASLPNPALVGYLNNWDESSNGMPYMQLDAVPAAYNVINYSFGLPSSGTTDNIVLNLEPLIDANASTRTATFNAKMNILQNQGKKVLLSLGGAVAHGGRIYLETPTKRDNFILSVTNLLKTHPFDGLDIDIEEGGNATPTFIFNQAGNTVSNPQNPSIVYFIAAIKQIMNNYRGIRARKMLLTFAPERNQITGGLSDYAYANYPSSGSYLPIIHALRDSLDLVHTQLYGSGSDYDRNGVIPYCAGTAGNSLAVTEDLLLGYTLKQGQGFFSGLAANKIALGFPAPCQAASDGFSPVARISSIVNYFRNTGTQPPAGSVAACSSYMTSQPIYTKESSAAVDFRGLMTWSINYDVNPACGNNTFASNYLALYGTFTTSSNPKNILSFSISGGTTAINSSTNSITVTMPSGTNLAALAATYTLSPNCSTLKASGGTSNFSFPVQFTINHTDNSSKTWTVTVLLGTSCVAPSNPSTASASPTTISSGGTTVLTASGCGIGLTYRWKQGTTVVALNASFTTPSLSSTTNYTAHCVNGACESSGINISITVSPPAGGGTSENISISVITPTISGGTRTDSRTFVLHRPTSNPDCNLPVVMAFHGDGGNGVGMESNTGFSTLADAQNFFAIYPNKLDGQSYFSYRIDQPAYLDGQIDQAFVQAIINYMFKNFGINKNRVYATGHSSGAAFVYFLTAKLPNSIAAFAPVAGFPQDYSAAGNVWTNIIANPGTPKLPILHIHGTVDAVGGTQFSSTNLPNPYPATPTNNSSGPYIWPIFPLSNKSCTNEPSNYTTTLFQVGNNTVDKLIFCANSATNKEVSMMIVRGMGHDWPSASQTGGLNGTASIWDFMKTNALSTFSNLNPAVVSPLSVSINAGQSTTLTASGCETLNYFWSNGQSGASITVSPTVTTNYSVACKSVISNCQNGNSSPMAVVTVSGSSPCSNVISVSTSSYPSYTANQIVKASQAILTVSPPNIIINSVNSNKLTYQAGNSIMFNPGFKVENGAVFKAEITPCN